MFDMFDGSGRHFFREFKDIQTIAFQMVSYVLLIYVNLSETSHAKYEVRSIVIHGHHYH